MLFNYIEILVLMYRSRNEFVQDQDNQLYISN